jgi:hypothetical protein
VSPPPAVQPLTVYTSRRNISCLANLQPIYSACVVNVCAVETSQNKVTMYPTGQTRQWHTESRGDPRTSVSDRPRIERRFQGTTFHEASDGIDPWPQRTTLPLERRRDESSNSDVPLWRTRLERIQRQDEQQHNRCFEAGENRPPAPQPARRWSTPGPPMPCRSYGFGLRRPWRRQQGTQAFPEPRSSSRSGLGGASWRNNEANNDCDSGQSRATRSEWPPRATYNNDADECDSDGLALLSEQVGRSSAQREPGQWRNVSDDDHVRRNVGPHLSRSDDLGFEQHDAIPVWRANAMSRAVEKPGRRSVVSVSHAMPQRFHTNTDQVNSAQRIAPVSMVDSLIVRRTRRKVMQGEVATGAHINRRTNCVRPHSSHVARKSVAPFARDHDRNLDVDDNDTSVHQDWTSKRRASVLGKRKMKQQLCLTSDGRSAPHVSVVTVARTVAQLRGQEVGLSKEATTAMHQGPSRGNNVADGEGNKPTGNTRRRRKLCQFPEGCDKGAIGSTMFCKAHGGGKRCQYPEGCDKSAKESTMFCIAHGGGNRCHYPDGCDKSAEGSTTFCIAHGGGKRCQYPEGCAKSARGSTMFCAGHGGGKRCQYPEGCGKSARGSTIFCTAHGGGKRCQHPKGCDKGARGSTMFCKGHGGGKRCQFPDGCAKSAQGSNMFCIAHGGGQRCQYLDGCDKSAIGSTMFCVSHGGGKRCQYSEVCDKSARGSTMVCKAHGGGKRCQYPDGCDKSAQGSTMFCKAHGGGKRCQFPDGCDKSALGSTLFCVGHGGGKRCQYPEGCDKSAIGSTMFCAAHGGGKRCQYPEGCWKGAIGSTMYCIAHGGGKRCQFPEGCGTSAAGSTMFCQAHGGGKRCQHPDGCDKGAEGATMFCIAHGGGRRCVHESGCRKLVRRGRLCQRHSVEAGLFDN